MNDVDPAEKRRKRYAGAFEPGELVAGRYEVRKMLGRGGMGMVYLVSDRETEQTLALKTLLPKFVSNPKALKRFVREVNAVRQMRHRGIVRIFDAQKRDDLIYYTMEYIEGKSLRQWIQDRGMMGLGSTVRVLCLLCDALEHAHEYTIHRDLSPDNVMVLNDGTIKLLDFGLAKLTNTDAQLTMIGVNLGKMQYNSPEQRMNAAGVDKRADLYSVGVMFYEMLTGDIPGDPEPISVCRPELPQSCDAFLEKAMAELPDDRYQSAREMRDALLALYKEYEDAQTGPLAATIGLPPGRKRRSWFQRAVARVRKWFKRT